MMGKANRNRAERSRRALREVNPLQAAMSDIAAPTDDELRCAICGDTPTETPGAWVRWRDTSPEVEQWLCDDCIEIQQVMHGNRIGDRLIRGMSPKDTER